MRNDEAYMELIATTADRETSNRMLKELEKWDVFRDAKFDEKLPVGNMSSEFVVQEYCTDLLKVAERDDLNLDHQEIADKYNIKELLLGKNSKNNIVFVDYGN